MLHWYGSQGSDVRAAVARRVASTEEACRRQRPQRAQRTGRRL